MHAANPADMRLNFVIDNLGLPDEPGVNGFEKTSFLRRVGCGLKLEPTQMSEIGR
jgi:hypothetical protein